MEGFDIESCMIDDIREFAEESLAIMEYTLDLDRNPSNLCIRPASGHATIEVDFFDILTVDLVDVDNPLPDISDDFIFWRRIATLCELVWKVTFLPDNNRDFFSSIAGVFCFRFCVDFFFFGFLISE